MESWNLPEGKVVTMKYWKARDGKVVRGKSGARGGIEPVLLLAVYFVGVDVHRGGTTGR